jgi:hypothetical protein
MKNSFLRRAEAIDQQVFSQRNTVPPLGDRRQGDSGVEFKKKTRQPGASSREDSILWGVML